MAIVCVLDYGSGNVKSVCNLFDAIASQVVVSSDPAEISRATHLVLPGVGAFGATMRKIRQCLPLEVLERAVHVERKPFLGICVGMQVLASRGAEFEMCAGLDWIPGSVEQLDAAGLRLPHIGWNNVVCQGTSPLLAGLEDGPDFYFVHSYRYSANDSADVAATTEYGTRFCSVLQRGNLCGVQFHPEKSQRAGMRLAKNFLTLS